jgi:hypothetical protein
MSGRDAAAKGGEQEPQDNQQAPPPSAVRLSSQLAGERKTGNLSSTSDFTGKAEDLPDVRTISKRKKALTIRKDSVASRKTSASWTLQTLREGPRRGPSGYFA